MRAWNREDWLDNHFRRCVLCWLLRPAPLVHDPAPDVAALEARPALGAPEASAMPRAKCHPLIERLHSWSDSINLHSRHQLIAENHSSDPAKENRAECAGTHHQP
jgi:hypothetical protein